MSTPLPPAPNGKDAHGRFTRGNQYGAGNPTLRKVALLRQALLNAVSEQDIAELAALLLEKARGGDLAAIRELLDRTLGKPAQAVAITDADGEPLGLSLAALQATVLDALKEHPSARLALAVRLEELARAGTAGTGNGA